MDFNKFCENGKKIKLAEEKKAEIINICKESEVQKVAPFSPNFKRIAAAVCVLIIMVTAVFVYNKHNDTNDIPIHSATEQSEKESLKAVETTTDQPSQKIENTTEKDIGGGEILPRKYRNNYYQIPTFFAKIIDSDIYSEWEKEYYANNYADDTNVMVMVAYIKAFDIPKEEFERANLEYAKFIDEVYSHICLDPQDYADQEFQEIYNADIIYTFDNEIINEYYLGIDYPFLNEYEYIEAMEAGTYKTRTTEFIDIEQMETEIIAKYGKAEIVTEVTEPIFSLPEETTATDLSQIETNE